MASSNNAEPGRPPRALILVENLSVPFDRRVWREARTLQKAGWQVSVISPKGSGRDEAAYEEIEGVAVYRFRLWEADGGAIAYAIEYGQALVMMFLLALRISLTRGFDVIQICNPPDLLFLITLPFKFFGKKVIFDHHDLFPELYISKSAGKKPGKMYRALLFLERMTFRFADVVMSTNASYREIATGRGGKAADRVFIVRNGPELSRIGSAAPNPALKCGRSHLLTYVGMMGNQDGLDYLLRALARLKEEFHRDDFHAILVGDGPAVPDLKIQAEKAGIADRLTFTGLVGQDKVFEAIATATVCVCPDPNIGLNDKSTLVKVLEYMGLGKPVVAFNLTETRASAGDAALYATPNDEREFAEKIARLLDHPEECERLGALGKDRILNGLAWDQQQEHLLAAYRCALGR